MYRILLIVVFALISMRTVAAQSAHVVDVLPTSGLPVQILSASASGDAYQVTAARATVKNLAANRVLAVALKWTIMTGDKSLVSYTRVDFGPGGPYGPNRLQPGDSIELESSGATTLQETPVDKIRVSLDYVELADGTRYGSDSGQHSTKLATARTGALAERIRLRTIYKQYGLQALLSELDRQQ
jgi:hypothetical protein